jgi:hypothetical protein
MIMRRGRAPRKGFPPDPFSIIRTDAAVCPSARENDPFGWRAVISIRKT